MSIEQNLILPYCNWKGVYSTREIIPANVTFEYGNKYHGDSWLLPSVDVEKGQFRDFSFDGILRGVIKHTLLSIGECATDSKIDGVISKIIVGQDYK